jgi:3-methyladenine DNA glycosylase AlkD
MSQAGEIIAQLRAAPQDIASIRALRKRVSRQLEELDRRTLLGIAHQVIPHMRWAAYELVMHHRPTMETITRADVEKLGGGMRHWGDVDSFCYYVSGPAWRDGRIGDQVIRTWARSPDWCWRRAALVSTVPLRGDARRTLAVCEMLLADRHDLVVKAMSWALRALAKRDPASVRKFLAAHRGELAARVMREVTNKLTTGLKNPRRSARQALVVQYGERRSSLE